MDGGVGDKAEEEWKTKIAQQTKNKLDGEERKGSPKRRKISNEGLLDTEGKMDENIGILSSENVGDQAFINQLQEEIQTKDLAIQALQFENQKLRHQQQTSPQNVSPMEKKVLEQYKRKIIEYQSALSQRDQVIGTLQTRLAELVQQRDEVVTESTQQTENFGREVETLKLQLQEAADALTKKWVTGVNPREHLLLKNKLIALQQSIEQDRQLMEELTRQLTEKAERCNLFELKYKQCLQKCKQLQLENEDVKNRNKAFEEKLKQLEEDTGKLKEKYESELLHTKEKVSTMTKEQQQTASEIQSLMKKLQDLTLELQTAKEEHERQMTVADERLGNEITLIKQKIGEQHQEEISKIETAHKSELAQVQQQIDTLEKLQKEDHASLLQNLEAERNRVQVLESSVQDLTKEKEMQLEFLQEEQSRRLKIEEQLNLEQEKVRDLNEKNNTLTKELETKDTQIEAISNELAQSKNVKDNLNSQIQSVEQQCREATENLSRLKEEEHNLKLKYDELVIEKENWLKEKLAFNAELLCVEKLNGEVTKLEAEVKMKMELERELVTIQNVQVDLKNRCESYEKQISDLQEELEKKNLEIMKLKEEGEQVKSLSNELAQSKAEKELLNSQILDIQQKYDLATETLRQMEEQHKNLDSEYKELQKEKEKWLIEKESLLIEIRNIEKLKEEVMKFQEEMKIKMDMEEKLISLKESHACLERRCTELEQCEKYSQELQSDLERKNIELKDVQDKYLSLHKEYNVIINADWLDNEVSEESDESSPIKVKVNELMKKLKETDKNLHSMESNLEGVKFDKEALLSEMEQLRKTCDSMERQKNETESELEKMMDQYKMMESELVSTRLALDREVQLATHQRLTSDVGVSVSASVEDCTAQTASVSSGMYPNEYDKTKTATISSEEKPNELESEKEGDMTWKEKYSSLEKSKKECDNEIEKLKVKTHDQYFAIQSLENIKSKLSRRIEELEAEKKALRDDQKQMQILKVDEMENHTVVGELKIVISRMEEKLRQAEEDMNQLQTNLQNLVKLQSPDNPEFSQKIIDCLESVKNKSKEKRQIVTGNVKVRYDIEIEEIHIIYEGYKKCLSDLQDALHQSDKLNKEKLDSHLENVELKREIQKLKVSPDVTEKEGETKETSELIKDKHMELPEKASVEMDAVILQHEIERLKIAMNQQQVRLRLENLWHQSPKLPIQGEQRLTGTEKQILSSHLGSYLKEILEDWEEKAKSEPSIASFISSETYKVHNIIEKLDEMIDSPTSHVCMETGIKFLRDAVVKALKNQYKEIVEKALKKIDKDISKLLELVFPSDITQILDIEPSSEEKETGASKYPCEVEDVAEKVEKLINARSMLVNVVIGFEENLKDSLTSEFSSVSSELERMVKCIASEEKDKIKQPAPDAEYSDIEYDQFIQEFMEIVKKQFDGDQAEKVQLLENQKMMVNRILEDNKAKLLNLCRDQTSNINNLASLPDAIQLVNSLVKSLENTLSHEVSWVEQQYKELLEQYTYEQNRFKQTYSQTLNELVFRLESMLKERSSMQLKLSVESQYEDEMMKMKEDHAAEVARLENQLAARDNDALMALDEEVEQLRAQIDRDLSFRSDISRTLYSELENIKIQVTKRHLQSLYSDRDWYKKTVGLLSHVTLQLLHYYSVAENYTHKSHATPAQHDSIQYEMTSGKVLDLSFLSDCVPDDSEANQYNVFPEDSAVSTGLIGKTVEVDHCEEAELGSNAESMLDSTAMSEGMLDDMDKDEQVRKILTKSYPQLMSILKGRWDRVIVDHLEKEVQELTIALQASAGMLKIFMHSVTESQDLSSHTIRDESMIENRSLELSQHIDESDHKSNIVQLTSNEDDSDVDIHPVSPNENLTNIEDTEQLSKLQLTSHFSPRDNEDLSQSLTQLLCHDESFMNLTKLKPQDLGDEEKLKRAIIQLCRSAEATDNLQLKLHHLEGLLKGCEEEKSELEEEIERLNHYNKNLAMELQTAKDQLEDFEILQHNKGGNGTTQYAAKMEASKDIKERVRAVLSAKNKSLMNHTELVSRVGELEGMLEVLVRESDAVAEKLKAQVSDLSQQLEVADRQLRSSRQFLEEHASERDQEVEDLVQAKEKLQTQLREKDAVIAQHANLEKEVENLERDLREKSQELQDALALKEELLAENKTAVDKIWDLRDIIQSLEAQLDAKCVQELEVNTQVESLKSTLAQAQRHSLDLTQQLEEVQYGRGEDSTGYGEFVPMQHSRTVDPEEEENDAQHASSSLFDELTQKSGMGTHNAAGQTLLQVIEERLDRTTKGLEALQLSISSASQSDEDLSVKDHLDIPSLQELEDSRALSPSTLDRRLEDKLMTLERTTEAAVKRTRDLEMTVKNLRLDLDEAVIERDALQERSSEQLVKISSLEARLDELRRSDHPMVAEMRQRFTVMQEQLEQKRTDLAIKGRELEELRFNFHNLRTKLLSREEELERLMSASQPHSLPQTSAEQLLARHQQLEEELKTKTNMIEKLKKEVSEGTKGSGISSTLSYHLIEDKNAEIDNLVQHIQDIKFQIKEVATHLSRQGNLEEALNMLGKIAGVENFCDTVTSVDNTHNLEVLRREPVEVSPRLTPITVSTMKDSHEMTPVVEDAGQSSQELSLMSVHPDVLKVPENLSQESMSASTELRQVLDDVIEGAGMDSADTTERIPEDLEMMNVTSGTDQSYKIAENCKESTQKKLEEDYRMAQDLLEAREAEITQLSEEIEDVVPQPLPSETVQIQDRCYRLEEQLLELQGKLENVESDYEEEKKWRKESDEKILGFEKEKEKMQEALKESMEKIKTTEMELRQAKLSLEEMVDQVQQIKQKYTEQSVILHCKEEELIKVSSQVDQIQLEMKEKLLHAKRELTKVEQQYQQEILEVKEEQIVREKQLCSDYEERMADQVSDLTKLVREKEETISQIRHYYESQLKEALMQKDQALKKVTEWREKLRVEEAGGQSRDISRLCDSLEELKAGVAQEVNKSDQLDTSLVSYLKQGQEKENAGRSDRASSTFSDLSDDENGDVANKIQKLMLKVHQKGVQVLSLIELMFLQKHQSHLNTSQRSLISQSGLLGLESADNSSVASREVSPRVGTSGIDVLPNRERTQLLRRMASLEEELSRKEREMKEKVEQMEFRIEQEKIAADELKLNNDADKRRMEKLSEQLHQERLLGADQISEITFLRSQHTALQVQLQKLQEERNNLRESLDNFQKQIESLRADLQAERANFTSVSKVLNQQRRLSSTTKNQQNQVIKDLRDTLEREREKIISLRAQLNEGFSRQTNTKMSTSRNSGRMKQSDFDNSNIVSSQDDVKVQLAIEQERVAELQRSYDKEVMKVLNLTEQLRIERSSSKTLLMEEQGKCAEFTKLIRNLEGEKDKLKRKMASDHERMQRQELRIRELEADITKLESELRAQAAAHEMASHRVREGDAQLHSSYTSVLNKLGEAEAELCSLRLKNNLLSKDLELAREKEMQLQQELTTEKMAINRLGLPALAKINNLNEYFELQLKENVELCKSVLRLTDNRHAARLKIVSLEDTIADLTEQLIKAKAAAQPSPSPERILQNERSVWETERAALQSLVSRKDAELMRMRRDVESRLSNQNFSMQTDDSRVQYIYGQYLRSESWRKALVYQKKYLLVVLQGYEATEQNTYSRLNYMAERVYGPLNNFSRASNTRNQPNNKFRVRVLVVIACCRLRFMVQRWKRSKRLGSQVLLPNPPTSSIPATPEPALSSRPESAASGPGSLQGIIDEARLPLTFNRTSAGATWGSITGHTPPTKESSKNPSLQYQGASATRRNLFVEQESSSLNEYIERLGNIHSKLGLTPKNI